MEPKFIGKGSYGCVFAPNLAGEKYPPSIDYASKVIRKKDVGGEFIKPRILKLPHLDPTSKYLVYPLATYQVTAGTSELLECPFIDEKIFIKRGDKVSLVIKEFNQLYSTILLPNGGDPLYDFKINVATKNIFPMLLKISKCIALLNFNHIIHHDIKDDNILFSKNNGARLIDFGLAIDYLKPLSAIDTYIFWPMDYFLYSNLSLPMIPIDYTDYTKTNLEKLVDESPNIPYFYRDILLTTALEFYNKYTFAEEEEQQEINEEIFEKFDVYSFGITILVLLSDNNIEIPELRQLIAKMIQTDPTKRASISSVHAELLSQCQKYKLLTPAQEKEENDDWVNIKNSSRD